MKGICASDNNQPIIKYLSPAGAGLGYSVIKVDEKSKELWNPGKTVEFQIQNDQAVIIPSLQDKVEKFFSKFNPFDSPHAGISKIGTGPGVGKKQIPLESNEKFGQLFYSKEKGWIVLYNVEEYRYKGLMINSEEIKVHPKQAETLSVENDNEKRVFFTIEDFYVEPPETIHSNRGAFIKVAKLTSDARDFNKEIELFHPETSSHEVFAIKDSTAFIGYKLPNGDFYFECIPFTEKKSKNIQEYVQEQIQLKNIEANEKTWMESICQYWFNKGKKSK